MKTKIRTMNDFKPGTHIERTNRQGTTVGRYEVLDPPRTRSGKLRLRGPRGGVLTTWWHPESLPWHCNNGSIRVAKETE